MRCRTIVALVAAFGVGVIAGRGTGRTAAAQDKAPSNPYAEMLHVGVVVKDLEQAVAQFKAMGFTDIRVSPPSKGVDRTYHGRPIDMALKQAFIHGTRTMIELMSRSGPGRAPGATPSGGTARRCTTSPSASRRPARSWRSTAGWGWRRSPRASGPEQRDRAALDAGGGHRRVGPAELGPVAADQQPLRPLADRLGDDFGPGAGDFDALVAGESPGALDGALGSDRPGHLSAELGEVGPLTADGGGGQNGERPRSAGP
jgi:hypothetical protein